jgi:hypothetical protein
MVGLDKQKTLLILVLVAFWGTGALADSLDPFWEGKITRGIESYLIKPIQDFLDLPKNESEYNRLVKVLREIPVWLDKPGDLEEVRVKMVDYQKDIIETISRLNQEKIPHLGIFNTTWTGILVEEINQREIENIFNLINRSLEEYRTLDQTVRPEKVCMACIEKLKSLLKTIPAFTPEFKTTLSYARNRDAIYQGSRLVAGFIEHFGDFNIVNIRWDSQDPASAVRVASQREIRWDSAEQPSFQFVIKQPPEKLTPAWEALGIFPEYTNTLGEGEASGETRAANAAPKSVGYYYLKSYGDQESQKAIRWALLSFETERDSKEFWANGSARVSIKRHGEKEDFDYLTLEKLSWMGRNNGFFAYGGRYGSYVLLAQPGKGSWVEKGTEEHQIIKYLAHRLTRS